jgi:hypothetical protein
MAVMNEIDLNIPDASGKGFLPVICTGWSTERTFLTSQSLFLDFGLFLFGGAASQRWAQGPSVSIVDRSQRWHWEFSRPAGSAF